MEKIPNIEKMKIDINNLLNQFYYQHQFYDNNKNLSSPEYTKNLRKIYNQINTEIDKLRLYKSATSLRPIAIFSIKRCLLVLSSSFSPPRRFLCS